MGEGNLARLSKGDLRLPAHRMELQRIRFVINSYLRARLEKIESQVWHYTGPGEAGSRMTQEESAFAMGFRESGTSLMNSLVLKHLPGAAWDETVDLQVGAQHLHYNLVRGLLDEGCV